MRRYILCLLLFAAVLFAFCGCSASPADDNPPGTDEPADPDTPSTEPENPSDPSGPENPGTKPEEPAEPENPDNPEPPSEEQPDISAYISADGLLKGSDGVLHDADMLSYELFRKVTVKYPQYDNNGTYKLDDTLTLVTSSDSSYKTLKLQMTGAEAETDGKKAVMDGTYSVLIDAFLTKKRAELDLKMTIGSESYTLSGSIPLEQEGSSDVFNGSFSLNGRTYDADFCFCWWVADGKYTPYPDSVEIPDGLAGAPAINTDAEDISGHSSADSAYTGASGVVRDADRLANAAHQAINSRFQESYYHVGQYKVDDTLSQTVSTEGNIMRTAYCLNGYSASLNGKAAKGWGTYTVSVDPFSAVHSAAIDMVIEIGGEVFRIQGTLPVSLDGNNNEFMSGTISINGNGYPVSLPFGNGSYVVVVPMA